MTRQFFEQTNVLQVSRIAVLAGAFQCSTSICSADCSPQWLPGDGLPGLNGTVFAMTNWDPDGDGPQSPLLILGGAFTVAGNLSAANIAGWDGENWYSFGSGMTNGLLTTAVRALTVYEGELIAGGDFAMAGGVTVNNIARWNGVGWQSMGSGMGGTNPFVYAFAEFSGELIAAGRFSTAGGLSATSIARWNGITWQTLGSGIGGTLPTVLTLSVHDGKLIAGGDFSHAGGVQVNFIASWNGTSWGSLGSGMGVFNESPYVNALTTYNGDLIAAGRFTTANSISAIRVARWDGSTWHTLGSGITGGNIPSVNALTTHGGELIAGGEFTTAGGLSANRIARWNGVAWQPMGSGFTNDNGSASQVFALASFNGQIVAGGNFDSASGAGALKAARWNGSSWSALGSGVSHTVAAFTTYRGELVVGGYFTAIDGVPVRRIARWNGSAWQALGSGLNGAVRALAVYGDYLIAGGEFTNAGGVSASRIAAWNGFSWQPLGGGTNGEVYALTTFKDELIVGGVFGTAGSTSADYVARWNGSTWLLMGQQLDNTVTSLSVHNSQVFAGGFFAGKIRRWDGTTWQSMNSGLGCTSSQTVYAIVEYQGQLIAGSNCSTNPVMYWNGSSWVPLGGGIAPFGSSVRALCVYDGSLIAGGGFASAGGVSASSIARWNGASWQPITSGADATVWALMAHNGELILGGDFKVVGGNVRAHFARWTDANVIWTSQPQNTSIACMDSATFSVSPAVGYSVLGYQWQKDGDLLVDGPTPHGSVISGAQEASVSIGNAQPEDAGVYDVMVLGTCGTYTSPSSNLLRGTCGDANGDNVVNISDLLAVIAAWGQIGLPWTIPADVDGNGIVNIADLLLVIANWS